jgi:hypothetical protein
MQDAKILGKAPPEMKNDTDLKTLNFRLETFILETLNFELETPFFFTNFARIETT